MKIAICDSNCSDREKHLSFFQKLAEKHGANIEFLVYSNCEELLFHFEDKRFIDVVFMETKMSGMSGIEGAGKLRAMGYKGEIIFLTNQKDRSLLLLGYDVNALNFIFKNETSASKIEQVFLQAKALAELNEEKNVLFTASNEWINIPISSIRYFEMYKRLVSVYYGDEKFEFHSSNFANIEKQLKGAGFIRTHRSYLVAIKEIKTISFYTLTTRDGTNLPVGRTYYADIKKALKSYEQIHTVI